MGHNGRGSVAPRPESERPVLGACQRRLGCLRPYLLPANLYLWRDRWVLPRLLRKLVSTVEIVGPVALGVLAVPNIGHAIGEPSATRWTLLAAALTVIAVVLIRGDDLLRTEAKGCIDIILDALRDEMFAKSSGTYERHRITLFQLKARWKLIPDFLRSETNCRRTHVLVPRTRVPISGRSPSRCFLVHEHRGELCDAVAGTIFDHGKSGLLTSDLPDVSRDANPSEATIAEFAAKTRDTVKNVARERYYMRSIGGVTIYVHGKRWGVLMFDSCDPRVEQKNTLSSKAMRKALEVLTSIIEREQL